MPKSLQKSNKIIKKRKKTFKKSRFTLSKKIISLYVILLFLPLTILLLQQRQDIRQRANEEPTFVCLGPCPTDTLPSPTDYPTQTWEKETERDNNVHTVTSDKSYQQKNSNTNTQKGFLELLIDLLKWILQFLQQLLGITPSSTSSTQATRPTTVKRPIVKQPTTKPTIARQPTTRQPLPTSGIPTTGTVTMTGWPTANNTGYPHGLPGDTRRPVTLTPYTGPCNITVAGTVIDGKDITCNLTINARNVVIRNSRIRVGNVQAITSTSDSNNLLVEDTEVDGLGQDNSAGGIALIGRTGYTLRRVHAHRSGDILRIDGWGEVYDSWLNDPKCLKSTCHNDIIQSTNATHIRIVHNKLENPFTQTSAILLKADIGPISDVVVDRNLMNGGGYTFYWYDAGYKISNGRVTNNSFMRSPAGYWPKGGYWGPAAINATTRPTWTNNVWADNGTPL